MPETTADADLRRIAERVRAFAEARDWEAFHTPKNLVMALAIEAAELMEPFQWLTSGEAAALRDNDPETLAAVSEELADVAIYLVRLSDVLGVDLPGAIAAKLDANAARFPVDRIRGKARMPTEDAE